MELAKGFFPLPKTNKKESLLENGEAYNFELSHSDLETLHDKSRWQQLLKAAQWLWRPTGLVPLNSGGPIPTFRKDTGLQITEYESVCRYVLEDIHMRYNTYYI